MSATSVVIHVLGPIKIEDEHGETVHVSSAVRDVVALLVAAGSAGLTKDAIAEELWGADRPSSWKSAIRNRITRARTSLGAESISNVQNRYRLTSSVRLHSSGLLDGAPVTDSGSAVTLDWLNEVALLGTVSSPLLDAYRRDVQSARAARIGEIVDRPSITMTPRLLEGLRHYQRKHADDAVVTRHVVRAYIRSGDRVAAREILDRSRDMTAGTEAAWVDALDEGLRAGSENEAPNHEPIPASQVPLGGPSVGDRSQLFWSAADKGQWVLAYEIAMEGLLHVTTIGGGGRQWWPMLLAIPLEKLDGPRQTGLASTLAWQMRVADPVSARRWSQLAMELSSTPDEAFLAEVTSAFVGDVQDERSLLPLPEALVDPTQTPTHLHAYQVVLANHLERSSAADVRPVLQRCLQLFEASPEPYRQWHGMNLKSMVSFVAGDWQTSYDHAKQACTYAGFYGIPEADTGWSCHLLAKDWVRGVRSSPALHARFSTEDQSPIGWGLAAAAAADRATTEAFLHEFDLQSRMTFAVPLMVALAPSTSNVQLRSRLYERLQARTATSAIFGAGLMHLGPVDRMCAVLTDLPQLKRSHLETAVAVADDQNLRIWQVICRRELMELGVSGSLTDDIRDLATSPTLRELAGLPV